METELQHIGFIVDGNRRWARAKGLPTLEGHRKGAEKVELVAEEMNKKGIKFVTFFLFSTENWHRSPEEVKYLMKLANEIIEKLSRKFQKLNMRCLILGRPEPVDPKLWQKLQNIEQETSQNTGTTVCICFNYGGQQEIVDAAKQACQAGERDWTIESFAKYLYHPEVPNLDLIVRTSGEERLSGFMLWRAAYAELLFLKKHFPDINEADCDYILAEFAHRQRRFGR